MPEHMIFNGTIVVRIGVMIAVCGFISDWGHRTGCLAADAEWSDASVQNDGDDFVVPPPPPPYFVMDTRFGEVNQGFGYADSLLAQRDVYGPAFHINLELIWWKKYFGFGITGALDIGAIDENLVKVPGDDGALVGLHAIPDRYTAGFIAKLALVKRRHWLVTAGLGVMYEHLRLTFTEEKDEPRRYEEFRRRRGGVAFKQSVSVAYLFSIKQSMQIGPMLSVALSEGISRPFTPEPVEESAPAANGNGPELWPQVALSFVLLVSDPPDQVDAQRTVVTVENYFKMKYRSRSAIGGGILIPVGPVHQRIPTSIVLYIQQTFVFPFGEIGSDWLMAMGLKDTVPVTLKASEPHNPYSTDWELPSMPHLLSPGVVVTPFIWTTDKTRLAVGFRAGYVQHKVGRGGDLTVDDRTYNFDNFTRTRKGAMIGQKVEFSYFPAAQREGTFAWSVQFMLNESYTWSDGKTQFDTGEPDDEQLGLELWPMLTTSVSAFF